MNISNKRARIKTCMMNVYTYWWKINKGTKPMTAGMRLASRLALLLVFFSTTSFNTDHDANRLVGVWEYEEKNLHIEMFEEDGHFVGKMTWFLSSSESMMNSYRDTENPEPTLTGRPLIGLKLVEKLTYQGNDTWGSGKIYDPNSGYTWDAQIRLTAPNTVVVRGYWKFKWIGKRMVFNRLM
jgi:uncharacterized protein (DUF2147 family)